MAKRTTASTPSGETISTAEDSESADTTPGEVEDEGGDVEDGGTIGGIRSSALEGGAVGGIWSEEVQVQPPPHRDTVARNLAYCLMVLLGLTILVHYVGSMILLWPPSAASTNTAPPTKGANSDKGAKKESGVKPAAVTPGSDLRFKAVADHLDRIFHTLLPVLAGLVGSVITYYFTRDSG